MADNTQKSHTRPIGTPDDSDDAEPLRASGGWRKALRQTPQNGSLAFYRSCMTMIVTHLAPAKSAEVCAFESLADLAGCGVGGYDWGP